MGSVPSDIDKNKEMEEYGNTSKKTGASSPPPRIEEVEEKDHPDITSQVTVVTPVPSSSPKNQEVDQSCSDSVNVTDMPMEGPQEIEQEEEKGTEPQKHQEDKPSSYEDPDHDHTYFTASPNDVAVTKDNLQACPSSVVMKTSKHFDIHAPPPDPLPESTIEIVTSTTHEAATRSSKEVEHLQNEVTRLEAELISERTSKQELSTQLLQSQTQFTQLTVQLNEAASLIIEQQKSVNTVIEKEAKIESLQSDLLKEREEKSVISEQYEKQQRSLVSLTKEFNEIFEELQTHFANCCKPKVDQENQGDLSNMSLVSNQQLQNKLDQLTTSVQERYQFWTNEQRKTEEELSTTRKTMEELIELLEGMEDTSPKEKSTALASPPQKIEPSSSSSPPPNQQDGREHGKDPSQNLKCLCGQQFFSDSSLRNHIKRLTGELKYVCEECSMGFVYPSDLTMHLKQKHKSSTTPKNVTPKNKRVIWSCEFCNNSFFKADIYQSHRKTCGSATAGTSSADCSPPILVPSSTSNSPPDYTHDDSSDDEITVLEDDSSFTPSISSPLRQPPPNPIPSTSSVFPAKMSRVAQLYMSSSPISILPTPPPPPLPPGIVKVVQHTPIPAVPNATTNSPKKHCRDITKRHIGFFCICGIKFISRKRLDGHLTFRNGRIDGSTNQRWNPLTLGQIKKEKASSSTSSSTQPPPKNLEGNFKKVKNISELKKRAGGRPKSKDKHGVEPTNSLKCLCGKSQNSVAELLRHIRYHTATKTIPCEFCDKLFLTNSFLNRHYKTGHKVEFELMTSQSLGASEKPTNGAAKKISKPADLKKKAIKTAATSTPPVQVQMHRLDYSKSHRGNFCKCGRKFSSKRKLNVHLYRQNTENDGDRDEDEGDGQGDCVNLDSSLKKQGNSKGTAGAVAMVNAGTGFSKFTCMTCGENFGSNVDRIRHRVQAHGHGLF